MCERARAFIYSWPTVRRSSGIPTNEIQKTTVEVKLGITPIHIMRIPRLLSETE